MSQVEVAKVVAGVEEAQVRHAAGRDDHDVGVLGHHVGRLGIGVAADLDAEPRAFGEAPVDDAHESRAAA